MDIEKIISKIKAERKEAKEKANEEIGIGADAVDWDILFFNTGVMAGLGIALRIINTEKTEGV